MKNNIKILAVGDVSFTRDIAKYINKRKNGDYKYPLSYVKNFLLDSDISIANLETTITNRNESINSNSDLLFKSSPKSVKGLADSGINLVNLANNHSNDFKSIGLHDTIKNLKKSKINIIGIKGHLYYIKKFNNYKIGFIGISRKFQRLNNSKVNVLLNKEIIIKQIKDLKEKVDIVILSIHWGSEYKFERSKSQYELAKLFIKNGVDIILGHHPHVLQNMNIINVKSGNSTRKGYVFYSLGNFLFDSHVKKRVLEIH